MNRFRIFPYLVLVLFVSVVSVSYANQPVNPSFETGTPGQVPDGWTAWTGATKDIIMTDSTDVVPTAGGVDNATIPFEYDVPSDGSYWAGVWYANGEAAGIKSCIYQQVAVPDLSSGTISADVSVWNYGDIYDTQIFVGVDPTGGTDPESTDVYWIERWEVQWIDVPPKSGSDDHQWWTQEVPRPGAGSAVGALASWSGYNNDDSPITATGSQITIFLYTQNKWLDREASIRFDNVKVFGDWATNVVVGTPPEVSNLTTPADGPIREASVEYTLTDAEDADADADLSVAYQIGSDFEDSSLFGLETYPLNAVSVVASSTDGNGTGMGTVRLTDTAIGDITGGGTGSSIDAGVLSVSLISDASQLYSIETEIVDLDLGTNPYAGVGIVILPKNNPTADGNPYFAVSLYRDNLNNVLYPQMKSSSQNFSAAANLWANMPTDGSNTIYLRARRGANGDWRGDYSLNGTQWLSAGRNDPCTLGGTAIDFDQELTVGLFVQNGATANFEYVSSGFLAATSAATGDGKTGLASTSAGDPHSFVWDAPFDVGLNAFASRVQLRLTGSDDDGAGTPVTTGFFKFVPNSATNVGNWSVYR